MLAMGRIDFSRSIAISISDATRRSMIADYQFKSRSAVYIVLIAWLYVVIMIAVVSDSILKGVVRLVFLGVIPVGLWFWMSLRRSRRVANNEERMTVEDTEIESQNSRND
jgi:uncharacterized membrane protein